MTYEVRDDGHCARRLTPSERRALLYEKEPVRDVTELWERYPEGGRVGWYCLVVSEHALYGWDEGVGEWTELGQGLLNGKHDRAAGMLLRFLEPGRYSERQVRGGEVVVVPLSPGSFTFFFTRYPRSGQTVEVAGDEAGQVVLIGDAEGVWEKVVLPIYDYIQGELAKVRHNRGVVLQNPNGLVFDPLAQEGDYVYFKEGGDVTAMMWVFRGSGGGWIKTGVSMPTAEVADLSEYALHGYGAGERVRTLAEVDDDVRGLTDNVDGGTAFSLFGGCRGIDGGDAFGV